MSDLIKVTPEKLKTTAASFHETGMSVKKTTADMMSLIVGISNSIWSGEACSSYIGKFRGLQTDVAKMYKMIEDQVSHLNTIAMEYQSSESQSKAAAEMLKNNVVD